MIPLFAMKTVNDSKNKKLLTRLINHAAHYRPKQSYRVFNTWMGDPSKVILLEAILEIIKKENLLDRVTRVGDYMLKNLKNIQNEHSNTISAVRGRGTFIAFNCASSQLRDAIVKKLLTKGKGYYYNVSAKNIFHTFVSLPSLGIQAGGCGNQAVRLRPALTFTERHADIFFDALRSVLKE